MIYHGVMIVTVTVFLLKAAVLATEDLMAQDAITRQNRRINYRFDYIFVHVRREKTRKDSSEETSSGKPTTRRESRRP